MDITYCSNTTCPIRDTCTRGDTPNSNINYLWIHKFEFIDGYCKNHDQKKLDKYTGNI